MKTCRQHPREKAGWTCGVCRADLCPDCVASRKAGFEPIPICTLCGALAHPILVTRNAGAYLAEAFGALAFPFHRGSLLAITGCALAAYLIGLVPMLSLVLAPGIVFGFLFAVVRSAADGDEVLRLPDSGEWQEDVVYPCFRGILATSFAWAPSLIYELSVGVPVPLVVWSLRILGISYVPAAVLVASMGGGLFAIANPVYAWRLVSRVPRDYAVALAFTIVLGALSIAAFVLGTLASRWITVPVLSGVIGTMIPLFPLVALARVLGLLVFVRGPELGWSATRRAALGDARPRGVLPSAGGGVVSTGPARFDRVAELESAIALGDLPRASLLHGDCDPNELARVAPSAHIVVGRHVASSDPERALRALRAATANASHPDAPAAFAALAWLHLDVRNDRPAGERILRFLLDRYPRTEASAWAAERLKPGI